MKLYSAPGTCATASHITLEWIGQPYEVEHLDYAAMKTPDYLKLNPSGVVPTLVTEGRALSEASAVLMYLVDHFPNAGIGPATGSAERIELNQWLLFLSATLHPYLWPYFSPDRFTTAEQGHAQVVEAAQLLVDKALTRIDQHLCGKSWMVGEEKSVADALLYPMANWTYAFPKSTAEYRNIDRIIRRLASDHAVLSVHRSQGTRPKVSIRQ